MKSFMASPLMDFLTTLSEFIVLNLLFILCSLPIITIGASINAMYRVCLQEARQEYGYKIRTFLKCFRADFLTATGLFFFFFGGLFVLIFNLLFWFSLRTLPATIIFVVLLVLTICFFIGFFYAFPLNARFDNSIRQTIKNAFLLGLKHKATTLLLCLTHTCFILFVFFIPKASLIAFLVGFSFLFYLNSIILTKVFLPYESEQI